MDCPENKKDSIVSYSLTPDIMYQGTENLDIDYTYDLMTVAVVHLSGDAEQSKNQLIGMLDTLLGDMDVKRKKQKLQEDFHIPMTVEIDQGVTNMCNLSAGLWEKAMTEGIRKGEHDGRLEGKLQNLRDIIMDGLTTLEKLRATGRYTAEELSAVANSLKH